MSEKYYDHVLPEREEKIRLIRCKIIVLEAELRGATHMSEEPIYFVAKLRKHGISKGVRLDLYAPIKYEVQEALDLKPGDIVQLSIKKIEREGRRT